MLGTPSVRRRLLVAIPVILAAVGVARLLADGSQPAAPPVTASTEPGSLMIELGGVPGEVSLPLSAKENHLITATVRGTGAPAAVWLARSADASFTVALQPAGDGHYQLNLADHDLVETLRRTGRNGQFRIFAKDAQGLTAGSVPVSFELRSFAMASCATVHDGTESVNEWVRVGETSAVQVDLDPPYPGAKVVAKVGDQTWTLKENGVGKYALPLTPDMRAAWTQAGTLTFDSDKLAVGYVNLPTTLRSIPRAIPVPAEGLSVWVGAQSRAEVPGSNGYLFVRCAAVTATSASLEFVRADERPVDPDLEVGAVRGYRYEGQQLAWGPTRIEYLGKVQSRVQVTVWTGPEAERKILARLPARVASYSNSSFTMRFHGRTYEPAEAAQQLSDLMSKSNAVTVGQFLDAVRAREKTTGSECIARSSPNGDMPLRAWVIDELENVGWRVEAKDLNAPAPAPAAE